MNKSDTLNNVVLSWTCEDFLKDARLFGDSYLQYADNRWTYYLHEYGFDKNVLINGYGGENSDADLATFKVLIKYGNPKYALWFLGMNDGSDNGAPTTRWLNDIQEFISICKLNHIIPVLSTIPSVPSINNEYKNTWVRNSSYRYIDMAKAVGAQADGTWYGDMLATDNVHPNADGARALFAQVLTDFPEIMVEP